MLKGSTTPRVYTQPLVTGKAGPCGCGCALTRKTSLGFNAVDFIQNTIGIKLLPWQRWLFIHAMELRPDGMFRYSTILILIARQNGKTTWVEFKNLWKLFVLGVELVISTAQNLDLAEESWVRGLEIIQATDDLAPELKKHFMGNGKKALWLNSGSQWKIAAASSGGGRGKSGDDVNLDELREHRDWVAWGAITKSTMAKPNSQVFAFSNAGDDRSLPLNALRKTGRALAQQKIPKDDTFGLFEWSVPDNTKCTCERTPGDPHADNCMLWDRRLWAMANPSLGYRITEAKIASALNTDPDEVFLTEVLCRAVPDIKAERVINSAQWEALKVQSEDSEDVAYAVRISRDRRHAVIAGCRKRKDGRLQVNIVAYRTGTNWLVDEIVRLRKFDPVGIAIPDKGPTATLLQPLAEEIHGPEAEVKDLYDSDPDTPVRGSVVSPWAQDVADGFGMFVDAVREGRLTHLDDAPLNAAVGVGQPRSLGTGLAWEYRSDTVDMAPLEAGTDAVWLWLTRAHRVKMERDEIGVW